MRTSHTSVTISGENELILDKSCDIFQRLETRILDMGFSEVVEFFGINEFNMMTQHVKLNFRTKEDKMRFEIFI